MCLLHVSENFLMLLLSLQAIDEVILLSPLIMLEVFNYLLVVFIFAYFGEAHHEDASILTVSRSACTQKWLLMMDPVVEMLFSPRCNYTGVEA